MRQASAGLGPAPFRRVRNFGPRCGAGGGSSDSASCRVLDVPVLMQRQVRVFAQVQHVDRIFHSCQSWCKTNDAIVCNTKLCVSRVQSLIPSNSPSETQNLNISSRVSDCVPVTWREAPLSMMHSRLFSESTRGRETVLFSGSITSLRTEERELRFEERPFVFVPNDLLVRFSRLLRELGSSDAQASPRNLLFQRSGDCLEERGAERRSRAVDLFWCRQHFFSSDIAAMETKHKHMLTVARPTSTVEYL